ncbi:MAG TPA: orotidine-5'-phosphate decarboxylase [Pyrinomonadaceae bacterium]|nr:orotidine-5'-phosphate decarboxylase [Pyrinomonadaceae bacterium]
MNSRKLIVALDVESATQALEMVQVLRGVVGMFKIGSQLFTAAGPDLVRDIVRTGERVFLDLKFHDIPNTVAAAGVEAARLGVSIFNVHAAGGAEMMRRTADAVSQCVIKEALTAPKVIAVTVLTSADQTTLTEIGFNAGPEDLVRRFALLAESSGMDGVVASPNEVGLIREAVRNPGFIVVTPGVRPAGAPSGDQKRVTTPREAIAAGADYLVVGRPILAARDPALAASKIVEEMQSAPENSA